MGRFIQAVVRPDAHIVGRDLGRDECDAVRSDHVVPAPAVPGALAVALPEGDAEGLERADAERLVGDEKSCSVPPPFDRVDRPLDAFRREAAAVVGHADGAVRLERIEYVGSAACAFALLGVDEQFDPAVEGPLTLEAEFDALERAGNVAEIVGEEIGHTERARLRRGKTNIDVAERCCLVRLQICLRDGKFAVVIPLRGDDKRDVAHARGNAFEREHSVLPGLRRQHHAVHRDGCTRDCTVQNILDGAREGGRLQPFERGERDVLHDHAAVRRTQFLPRAGENAIEIAVFFRRNGVGTFGIEVGKDVVARRIRARRFDHFVRLRRDRDTLDGRSVGILDGPRKIGGRFHLFIARDEPTVFVEQDILIGHLRIDGSPLVSPTIPVPGSIRGTRCRVLRAYLVHLPESDADGVVLFDHDLRIRDHDFHGVARIRRLVAVVEGAV